MGNLVLNIGSVSLTVVLFGCATFLLWDGNSEWTRFFNLAVYFGVWSFLWGAAQMIIRRTLVALKAEYGEPGAGPVLILYLLAVVVSGLLTMALARFLLSVI